MTQQQTSDPIQRLAATHEVLRMQCMCQWLSEPPIDQSTHKVCHGTGWALRPRAELLGVLVDICGQHGWEIELTPPGYPKTGQKEWEAVTFGHYAFGPDPETALALAILAAEDNNA